MQSKSLLKIVVATSLLASSFSVFAAGNLSVSKDILVNATPSTVWKMVGNFNGLDVWHPVVVNSELKKGTNDKPGAERLLTLGNGATITEKLLGYSDKEKSYAYAIVKSPLPVANYESKIMVSDVGNGKTKVSWSSSFDAHNATDEEAISAISGVYEAGLSQVQKDFAQ